RLARQLALLSDAPKKTVQRLAEHDDIAIAEPVLLQAEDLEDSILLEVTNTKTQRHRLAIACRRSVSAPVVDALAESGGRVVLRYLVNNPAAAISPTTAAALAQQARGDKLLARLLLKRFSNGARASAA